MTRHFFFFILIFSTLFSCEKKSQNNKFTTTDLLKLLSDNLPQQSKINIMSAKPITDDLGLGLIGNFKKNGILDSLKSYKNEAIFVDLDSYKSILKLFKVTDTIYFDFIEYNSKLSLGFSINDSNYIINETNQSLVLATNYSELKLNYYKNIYPLINKPEAFPTIDSQSLYTYTTVNMVNSYLEKIPKGTLHLAFCFGLIHTNSLPEIVKSYPKPDLFRDTLFRHIMLNHNKLITVCVGLTTNTTPKSGTYADVNSVCPIYCTSH